MTMLQKLSRELNKAVTVAVFKEKIQIRGGKHMSKAESIWQLFVLCLLALRDTVPKCYFLLQFGTPKEKLPNGLLPPPAF